MTVKMLYKDAVDEINRNWETFMSSITSPARKSDKGKVSYICPLCGNGTGESGDGLTRNPNAPESHPRFSCWKCGEIKNSDIIDVYRMTKGITDKTEVYQMAEQLGIEIVKEDRQQPQQFRRASERQQDTQPEAVDHYDSRRTDPDEGEYYDFMNYYKECAGRINDPAAVSYLRQRGISMETAKRYGVGYDPHHVNPNSKRRVEREGRDTSGWTGGPYLIIPISREYFVARRTDGKDFSPKMKGGHVTRSESLFNGRLIDKMQKDRVVFVTEAVLDALSIIEAGGMAVALDGTGNRMFNNRLKSAEKPPFIILALDNDKTKPDGSNAGRDAMRKLASEIDEMNRNRNEQRLIRYRIADVSVLYDGLKDANELLQKDASKLRRNVENEIIEAAAPNNTMSYVRNFMAEDIDRMKASIKKTGFANLDEKSGGIRSGLYVLAATASLGKSTFCHQLAENLAEAGEHVLFFSLEMSVLQMVSKSIARRTAKANKRTAVSSVEIMSGKIPPQALKASEDYAEHVGRRLSIIQGGFSMNVNAIESEVERYISFTGKTPTVFIDYLQILTPMDGTKARDRRGEIDESITALKKMADRYNMTVFCVSNVNRAAYIAPVDFEALKESGNIEFSADCVFGLEYQCMDESKFKGDKGTVDKRDRIDEAREETPRKIVLKSLKNRYGAMRYKCYFDYWPAFDLFEEGAAPARSKTGSSGNCKPEVTENEDGTKVYTFEDIIV